MKVRKIVLLLMTSIVLFTLVGCNSQEKRDAADSERLAIIEEKIDELFNEEKTDIIAHLSQEHIDEVEALLTEEKDNKFSPDNLKRIDSILLYLDLAIDMLAFEQEVDELFDEEGGLVRDPEIDSVEAGLAFYENENVFYDRQLDKITDAKEQLLAIEEVREQVDMLFVGGEVKSDVTREQEAEIRELIATLKSNAAKRELEGSLVKVATLLSGRERSVAVAQRERQEALDRQREAEETTIVEEEPKKADPVQEVNQGKDSEEPEAGDENGEDEGKVVEDEKEEEEEVEEKEKELEDESDEV